MHDTRPIMMVLVLIHVPRLAGDKPAFIVLCSDLYAKPTSINVFHVGRSRSLFIM